jgi:hypothetical protein
VERGNGLELIEHIVEQEIWNMNITH